MRLIDADALKTKKVRCAERREWVVPVAEIDWMPTIEPKKGRWIKLLWDVECSICHNTLDMDGVNAGRGDANFCPNCGAQMIEGNPR